MRHAVPAVLLLAVTACTPEVITDNVQEEEQPFAPAVMPTTAGTQYRGEILIVERFDNPNLGSRGWYDVEQPRITTAQKAPGSTASFECRFAAGATKCTGGSPGRRRFKWTRELYISYWVKYATGWVGSGRNYHPHEFVVVNSLEDKWVGPAYTRLTLLVESVGGRPRVALTDPANVNPNCVLLNNNSLSGCSGYSINTYPFGESKSVAACNGLVGPVMGRDCYSLGNNRWYSARHWDSPTVSLAGGTGWHFVETYLRMNSVVSGVGRADGEIRQWVDGQASMNVQGVLMRTGRHSTMQLNQLMLTPYIGDGSPIAQTVWYDDLTIARGKRP
jgi:hypothetical protein